MATTALISILHENGEKLCNIHVQHDGGDFLKKKLKRIIKDGRYINNLGFNIPKLGEAFLSMGCFAATLIVSLKKECGDVYITNNTNSLGLYDFTYEISFDPENKQIILT